MKVLVVGGGVAGVAAALAARRAGAETTLVEGSSSLGLDRSMLPLLLSGGLAPETLRPDPTLLSGSGVEVRLGERVTRVEPEASLALTNSGRLFFDALVLATGSQYLGEDVRGISKHGVFVMRSVDDYLALSEAMDGITSAVVLGPAPLSLIVANALSRRSRTHVFLGPKGLRFSGPLRDAIARAASERGVELTEAGVDAVIGMKRVEAVMSGGAVYPSDAVVVLPRSVPLLPELPCLKGEHAGVLVDHSMRTSSPNVFAAGDCAELKLGYTSLPSRLRSSAAVMGEVAGVNAAGGGLVRAHLARSMVFEAFGLEVCTAGLDAEEGRMTGLDVAETVCFADGSGEAQCASLVYDRATERVHGVQVAGAGALALSESASLVVSLGARLEDLAYSDRPYLPRFNTNKSPIGLTAGRALYTLREGRFEAQGTHLRPG